MQDIPVDDLHGSVTTVLVHNDNDDSDSGHMRVTPVKKTYGKPRKSPLQIPATIACIEEINEGEAQVLQQLSTPGTSFTATNVADFHPIPSASCLAKKIVETSPTSRTSLTVMGKTTHDAIKSKNNHSRVDQRLLRNSLKKKHAVLQKSSSGKSSMKKISPLITQKQVIELLRLKKKHPIVMQKMRRWRERCKAIKKRENPLFARWNECNPVQKTIMEMQLMFAGTPAKVGTNSQKLIGNLH